ncbi:MAG: hypothetical protein PHG06_16655 [Parabacteroides sp.]|nr:hypothetical protein [Parabacteroides sp.]
MSANSSKIVLCSSANESFANLITSINQDKSSLLQQIQTKAVNGDIRGIRTLANQVERIEDFLKRIMELENDWNIIMGDKEDKGKEEQLQQNEEGKQSGQTPSEESMKVLAIGDILRVETFGSDGRMFSNRIPIPLFRQIMSTTLKFIDKQYYVKVSDVLEELKEEIIDQSNYKKSPRIPIYIAFKMLEYKNIFKVSEKNSHHYELDNNISSSDMPRIIDNLLVEAKMQQIR